MADKFPRTLRLAGGREVRVVRVHYRYAKNVWRVEYRHAENHPMGCLAELFDTHWEETDRETVKQRHPMPERAHKETNQ